MSLELVGAALLKVAVTELLKAVVRAKEKASNYHQALTRLESTLTSVIPRVNQISLLNKKLNIPDEEMKQVIAILHNGQTLVNKCCKASVINLVRKNQLSKQLLELDNSLLRYFQMILPLDHVRDTKEILVMVRELHEGLVGVKDEGESSNSLSSSEIHSCQAPKAIDSVKQVTDTEEKNVTWMDMIKGWLYNNDLENVPTLIAENVPSLIEENLMFVPEIEEIIDTDTSWWWAKTKTNTRKFRLKGCIYSFDMIDNTNVIRRALRKIRYDVIDCECVTIKHEKVIVMGYENFVSKRSELVDQLERLRYVGYHPNIVPPIGFSYGFNGTLLFYDNNTKISLDSQLQDYWGRLSAYESGLIWGYKVKVSLGVSMGISHLHSVGLIHGNLNSSNVLLTSDFDGCIPAYGLQPFGGANTYSDVINFGFLLMEIISAAFPLMARVVHGGSGTDYCASLKSEMKRYGMLNKQECKMLRIARKCVEKDLDKLPSMEDVVVMLKKMVK